MLPSAPPEEHHRNGLDHDLDVLPDRTPLDVLEVVTELALDVVNRRVVLQVDLGMTGDPWWHPLASRVVRDLLSQLCEQFRPLRSRPHQVHVTLHHVQQLWQFVEATTAEEAADKGQASVL